MTAPPRRPPKNVPDSMPSRDRGTDVLPEDVRRTEDVREPPPDSPPLREDEPSIERAR
jgi:hypothetical protein